MSVVEVERIRSYGEVEAIGRFVRHALRLDPSVAEALRPRDRAPRVVVKPNWVHQAHQSQPDVWEPVITHPCGRPGRRGSRRRGARRQRRDRDLRCADQLRGLRRDHEPRQPPGGARATALALAIAHARGDRPPQGGLGGEGRRGRRASPESAGPAWLRGVGPRPRQPAARPSRRGALLRRRLRRGDGQPTPSWSGPGIPALGDGHGLRPVRERRQAEDPQEDRDHLLPEEPRGHQRRQELAAAPHRGHPGEAATSSRSRRSRGGWSPP